MVFQIVCLIPFLRTWSNGTMVLISLHISTNATKHDALKWLIVHISQLSLILISLKQPNLFHCKAMCCMLYRSKQVVVEDRLSETTCHDWQTSNILRINEWLFIKISKLSIFSLCASNNSLTHLFWALLMIHFGFIKISFWIMNFKHK